jgi:L-cystine uptake protein TcyP (sodium:dicarboxylate symporter family)
MRTKMTGMSNLSIVLFSYKIAFKVGTSHTPFQLIYGLHLLLLAKYLSPFKLGQNYDPTLVRVLTSRSSKLEKPQENLLIT